mmetsp:Transcript_18148/g.30786  ORF Transcript_18148/g.30786 Transcript_18148/m.30786 type:complete len:378 (-) Transcript_18148:1689-2822(-)
MMSSSRNDNATCADSGEKRKHQEMKQQSSSSNDDSALHTLFEKAQDRLKAAQDELDLAQQNMERIRWQIRASGNYHTEPDSLLCLCDGVGHLLAHVIHFLDMNDFRRFGEVCHTLKNQADGCWGIIETRLMPHPSLRSPSAHNCMERVARYMKASAFAKRIGAMGNRINRHAFDIYDELPERVYGHCTGCEFPDMNLDHITDEYEIFVRLSKTSNNEVLAEGFTLIDSNSGEMLIEGFDFSKWPELLEINGMINSLDYEFGWRTGEDGADGGDGKILLCNIMRDLTVVVVAVNKLSSEVSLVAANNDFTDELDIEGDWGSCSADGGHLSRSHGSFDVNEERKKLNLYFNTRVLTHDETREILKIESYWKVSLDSPVY